MKNPGISISSKDTYLRVSDIIEYIFKVGIEDDGLSK